MKWYLDLDDTLYKTSYGYGEILRAAAELYKIRPLALSLRVLNSRRKFEFSDGIRHSTQLFKAFQSYGIDPIEAEALLLKKLKNKQFLYPDAVEFLDWIDKKKIKPTIVTLGDPATQEFKISLIPRLYEFERVIVQALKHEYFESLPEHRAVIVDDRVIENLPNWCEGVFIERKRMPGSYKGRTIKLLTELIDER